MRRWFPRLADPAFLAAGAALLAACSPTSNVPPGPPVLTSMSILEAGSRTDITADTGPCAASVKEGDNCDPKLPVCQQPPSFCHCVAKPAGDCSIDMSDATTGGSWVCHYGPFVGVLAVFDRLLDRDPLDGGKGGPRADIASMTFPPPAPSPSVTPSTSYSPNGSSMGLVFNNFAGITGPSLMVSGTVPGAMMQVLDATPSGTAITVALDPTVVLSVDGKQSFTATGPIQDGQITFASTAGFWASITVPNGPAPPPPDAGTPTDDGGVDGGVDDGGTAVDAGAPPCVPPAPTPTYPVTSPDSEAVKITFGNQIDVATILDHITVTANGTPIAATDLVMNASAAFTLHGGVGPINLAGATIAPKTSWPVSATIEVIIDATASDVFGVTLGAANSASFTTSAM
jgi:hypothetical protein